MIFGLGKPKKLDAKRAVAVVEYLLRRMPNGEERPDIRGAVAIENDEARENFLRRIYLDAEERLLVHRISGWRDRASIRQTLRERFGLDGFVPDAFSVLFLPREAELFWFSRVLLERIKTDAGWDDARIVDLLQRVSGGTPLGAMLEFSDEAWNKAFDQFMRAGQTEREVAIQSAFRDVIARAYREFIKEQGESRAQISVENVVRSLRQEYGTTEGISGLLEILPEGILEQERITLAPRERLAQEVKRQMQELKAKNIALIAEAKQLSETAQALERAKAQTESMTQAQQAFITVVSHQFRTPLAAIRWQADALLDFVGGNEELSSLKELGLAVRERATFLIRVLENIFDMLEIDAGTYHVSRRRSSLHEVVSAACKEYEADAQLKNVSVTCAVGEGPAIFCDPDAIRRVMDILLTNAVNYSEARGTVEVGIERRKREGGGEEFVVSVRDHGIGIRPEDRPKLFEKFFRAKNASLKVPDGAGIALYIAKRIVELHGGKIWAESPGSGAGASFFFTIPVERVAQAEGVVRQPARAAAAPASSTQSTAPNQATATTPPQLAVHPEAQPKTQPQKPASPQDPLLGV